VVVERSERDQDVARSPFAAWSVLTASSSGLPGSPPTSFRATSGTEQKIPELIRFIKDAGRIPVQRDTLYRAVKVWA